jgi:hypothetical protein
MKERTNKSFGNSAIVPLSDDEMLERRDRLPLLRAARGRSQRKSYAAQIALARDYRLLLPLALQRLPLWRQVQVRAWVERRPCGS